MGMYWINTWCLSKPRPVYFFIVWFTGRAWYMTTCTMDPRTGIHRIKTAISGGGQQKGNIHVWLYSAVSHQTLQWFFFRFNSNIKCIESATKTNQNSTGLTWPEWSKCGYLDLDSPSTHKMSAFLCSLFAEQLQFFPTQRVHVWVRSICLHRIELSPSLEPPPLTATVIYRFHLPTRGHSLATRKFC